MKMLGKYRGYNPNINPSLSNSFVSSAFRLVHVFYKIYSICILSIQVGIIIHSICILSIQVGTGFL